MNQRSYYCWTQDKKEDKRLYLGFSGGSVVKNLPATAGDVALIRKITWKRKWQPTPAFLPEKPHE